MRPGILHRHIYDRTRKAYLNATRPGKYVILVMKQKGSQNTDPSKNTKDRAPGKAKPVTRR